MRNYELSSAQEHLSSRQHDFDLDFLGLSRMYDNKNSALNYIVRLPYNIAHLISIVLFIFLD